MNQIGTRLTWLLTAQTFLVSGAMIAIANSLSDHTHHPAVLSFLAALVSTVGLMISLRTFQILHAAMWTIDTWHRRKRLLLRSISANAETGDACHVVTLGRWLEDTDPVHEHSLKFARWIPRIFLIFWTILLFITGALPTLYLSEALSSS
jgi:hypothetical protein